MEVPVKTIHECQLLLILHIVIVHNRKAHTSVYVGHPAYIYSHKQEASRPDSSAV